MSQLGDWIEGILTRRPAGAAEPTLREQLLGLREQAGSGRALARQLGIAESTVRRILSGKTRTPKPSTAGLIQQAYRAISTRRISNGDLRMTVVQPGHPNRRPRELAARHFKFRDDASAARVREAYIKGGAEAAAAQFLREVRDRHYRSYLMPDEWRYEYEDVGPEVVGDYGYSILS